jgi:N-acyl-D-amino-acid deacylase
MPDYDLLIRDADVIDGSGAPRFRADVGVRDGRIAAIGDLAGTSAAHRLDLDGLALAPGFIDVHTHDDRLLLSEPAMTPKVSQGVTTVIVGNCGISLAPLGEATPAVPPLNLVAGEDRVRCFDSFANYFDALNAAAPAINCAALVGHTTLRARTMSALDRPADAREIAAMRALVEEALAAGVIGASTGTYYAPANAATAQEIREVLEPLRGTDAVIASHIRDETARVIESIDEALSVASELGVRQVISHHKVSGMPNFGRSRQTLAHFDELRREAQDPTRLCLDCYPYAASSTILRADSVAQSRRTMIAWSTPRPEASGRYFDEFARDEGLTTDAAIEALQPAGAIYFAMDEPDVERILAYPDTMIGSDGLPHDRFPHPRLWGAFPRVLGHYVRERGLMPLERAVHKMTGLSAMRFGLGGRGFVRPGCAADLVVFDPLRIRDAATFTAPMTPAEGIVQVLVNGTATWVEGRHTGAGAGRALRRGR